MKITWLGHSCFKIEGQQVSIILDPFEDGSVPGLSPLRGESANYVFISHEHADHNASHLIQLIHKEVPFDFQQVLLPHDKQKGSKRGLVYGRIFHIDGYSLAHLGDIGDINDKALLAPFKDVDVLLVPINGQFTISAREAKQLFDYLHPGLIIPMHYEMTSPHCGYPDGGQINEFKSLFPNYIEVNGDSVDINASLLKNNALVLTKFKGNK